MQVHRENLNNQIWITCYCQKAHGQSGYLIIQHVCMWAGLSYGLIQHPQKVHCMFIHVILYVFVGAHSCIMQHKSSVTINIWITNF